MERNRCRWADPTSELYTAYHDQEWGRPEHDDCKLFEMLILEGFQAGLSWITILKKREAFRRAFDGFNPAAVAEYGPEKFDALMNDPGIVRNRRKIEASAHHLLLFAGGGRGQRPRDWLLVLSPSESTAIARPRMTYSTHVTATEFPRARYRAESEAPGRSVQPSG